ncbi:MAG TPA: AcvB/VirJ family lysyl-phosphatidylglycerol hydrolase [Prolixibacteraceae bacterium]|nr:AcvB/VirJ family lysyl-phosphatidylglycerol hydrolase [Prolixibacteraceae bacterium]
MKQIALISILFLLLVQKSEASQVDTLVYGAFGKVAIYQPSTVPESFVLFISGDGGWNSGVVNMANQIIAKGALVAGIDIRHYLKSIKSLKSNCYYPAGDFEEMSLTIQKKYKLNQYLKPILVGYSSGATLAYGMLAQAPANTFKGAIAIGFCPDIETDRPLCKGAGLNSHILKVGQSYYLEPFMQLTAPFIALNGTIDQICNFTDTKKFVESMPMSELMALPNVGHGFSVIRNWVPQFLLAYQKVLKEPGYAEKIASKNQLLQSQASSLLKTDLPLTLIPTSDKGNLPLAFFISGDGGWTSFDQGVCEKLSDKGIPVVGLDAQKYFWNEKEPKKTAEEISVAIKHYMQLWNKNSFVLLGYSFGACVAPFIANNFPDQVKESLKGVYCFSPNVTGDFEIHIYDMLNIKTRDKYFVTDELKQIKYLNPICVFGNEEDPNLLKKFSSSGIQVETLPGNHHYNNDYNAISEIILKNLLTVK